MTFPEYNLHASVVRYLRLQYPKALFHSDTSAVKLPKLTAFRMAALNLRRGHPDLMIYEPRGKFCGMAIELKAEGTRLLKKNGELADEHLIEQMKYLQAEKPIRVQRKRTKGWKMPVNTKSVTRPGKFGNPYKIGEWNVWAVVDLKTGKSLKDILIEKNGENKYHSVEDTLLAFREKIKHSSAFKRIIKRELIGKNLACFCPLSSPCHADILLEVANEPCT